MCEIHTKGKIQKDPETVLELMCKQEYIVPIRHRFSTCGDDAILLIRYCQPDKLIKNADLQLRLTY